MTWSFLSPRADHKPAKAVDNPADKLLVEPNERGGWGLRFAGEPVESRIGNYPTPQDAERVARANCTHVEIVMPKAVEVGIQAMPTKSPAARLAELSLAK
jgi:hypothetical protein